MATTLVVTNDFPPRIGGIESFVSDVCELLDHDVIVYASGSARAAAGDGGRPYPVVRGGDLLLPTPTVARRAAQLLRTSGATRVVFGAAAPLGLLAGGLRRAGAEVVIGLTHGHESGWWARLPGARALLHRIGESCDHLTVVSGFTEQAIRPALSPAARTRLLRLAPPVDLDLFRPAPARERTARPATCVSVGRLTAQKGFDVLLDAWALTLRAWPSGQPPPRLWIVGDGPARGALGRRCGQRGLGASVTLTGAVPRAAVAALLQQADVFALPMRTRLAGLHAEALGVAALEAAACGLPVLVGRSGGAPETVLDGVSGYVVDADDPVVLARRLTALLLDPQVAAEQGRAGRAWVQEHFSRAVARRTLRAALQLPIAR